MPFKRYNIYGPATTRSPTAIMSTPAAFLEERVDTIIAPSGVFGTSVTVPVTNPFLSPALRTYFCASCRLQPGALRGNQTLTPAECAAAARCDLTPADPELPHSSRSASPPYAGSRSA